MKQTKLILIFFSLLSALLTYAEEHRDYMIKTDNFTAININDNVSVEYRASADSAGMILFKCDPSYVDKIIVSVSKSTLNVQITDDYKGPVPLIRAYSTSLLKAENGSDSTLHIVRNVPVSDFRARVIGNGDIIIDQLETTDAKLSILTGHGRICIAAGSAFKAKYSNVGTGTIQAGGLTVNQAKATISGTGTIDCYVTESLSITGMGTGKVYYTGDPKKVTNRSVGIKAIKL